MSNDQVSTNSEINELRQDANSNISAISEIPESAQEIIETAENNPYPGGEVQGPSNVFSFPVDHEGTSIYVKTWTAYDSKEPPVVIVHDLGENLGFYKNAAVSFFKKGHSVFCFDMRGHGCSGKMLGHINKFDELVYDLLQIAAWARHKSNGKPPIIVGQGVGSIVAMFFAQKYPRLCHASVLASPVFNVRAPRRVITPFIVKSLSEFWPTVKVPRSLMPLYADKFSTQLQKKKRSAVRLPVLSEISARFAYELAEGIARSEDAIQALSTDTLIMFGPDDHGICKSGDTVEELIGQNQQDKITVKRLEQSSDFFKSEGEDLDVIVTRVLSWVDQISK